jgi:hypothetical protein
MKLKKIMSVFTYEVHGLGFKSLLISLLIILVGCSADVSDTESAGINIFNENEKLKALLKQ